MRTLTIIFIVTLHLCLIFYCLKDESVTYSYNDEESKTKTITKEQLPRAKAVGRYEYGIIYEFCYRGTIYLIAKWYGESTSMVKTDDECRSN